MTHRFTALNLATPAFAATARKPGFQATVLRTTVLRTTVLRLTSAAIALAILGAGSVFAKDPFRSTNPAPISDNTSTAFEAFFKQGNYKAAADLLSKKPEPDEPLALAMKASLSYTSMMGVSKSDQAQKDKLLTEFQGYAGQTRAAAEKLMSSNPLRGNLYLAVSALFDGVYAFTKDGTVKGTPAAIGALQKIGEYMDKAEKIAPEDPELNLLRGYLDVYTGIYLPFSTPEKGLDRLQKFASPRYLADRGLAMGYMELNKFDQAMTAVESALAVTPENPDLNYLKAKILVKQKKDQESLAFFDKALSKSDQLLPAVVKEITRAQTKAKERLASPPAK
jgi:tetratricopeptide (TPR) repeat protein